MEDVMRMTIGALLAVALMAGSTLAADAKIARVYKAKCASCHGPDGKGDTEQGKSVKAPDFSSAAWQAISDDNIKKAIAEGKGDHQYKDKLDAAQIDGLVQVIREFKK
jgi:mono/diheme cytochrome c family protein